MRADELTLFGSWFDGHRDTRPKPFELPWVDFVATVMSEENFKTREDKFADAWGFNLARFVEKNGELRRANAHVDVLSGVVLDFDKNYDLGRVFDGLKGIVHLAFTTFSHTPEAPRWRVVIPTAAPIPGSRFSAVRAWLVTCLNGGMPPSTKYGADEQAKAVSNFYFAPGCPAANVEHLSWTATDATDDAAVLVPPPLGDLKRGIPAVRMLGTKIDWPWLEARMAAYPKDADVRRAFKAVLKGDSFAELGSRDTLLTRMCGVLAGWAPAAEPEDLAAKFAPSLAVMAAGSELDPPPTMEQCADKIARAQATLSARAQEAGEFLVSQAQTIVMPEPVELDTFAEAAEGVGLSAPDLMQRLLLRQDNSLWVWMQSEQRWEGPINDRAATWFAHRQLATVPGVVAHVRRKDGGIRNKTLDELAQDHGEVVGNVVANLGATRPHYDIASRTLTLVGAERRPLEPLEDPVVARWLELLGGNRASILLDWIAGITRHDRPNCVLFLPGDPGVGKSLLVRGLSRIWNADGATDFRTVTEAFNDGLRRCPLVVVEEGKWNRYDDITNKLRRFVTDASRSINKKFHQPLELSGHLRLMVTANNLNIFAGDQHALTRADRDAIAQRFLEIIPRSEARDFLLSLPAEERDGLAAGDRIARHALWLVENRAVNNPGRFWVEGEVDGSLADKITANDKSFGSWTHEWLARYLTNPFEVERENKALLYRKDGVVIVNPEAVINSWERLLKNRRPPQAAEISNALKTLSSGELTQFPGGAKRGFHIRVSSIVKWADDTGVGNAEDILHNAAGEQRPSDAPPAFTSRIQPGRMIS